MEYKLQELFFSLIGILMILFVLYSIALSLLEVNGDVKVITKSKWRCEKYQWINDGENEKNKECVLYKRKLK